MTYPQQPGQPYGSQPGWQPGPQGQGGYPQQSPPYGQQYPQQGQYPPSGGMGQQPHPGPGQYGQQPPMGGGGMGGGMGGGFGGPGPQPPKKSKTGLMVGIIVAVVAIAAFAVTAFVAPGFLLSEDKGGTAATSENSGEGTGGDEGGGDTGGGGEGGDSGGGDDSGGSDATALINQIVQGFQNKDSATLDGLVCPGSEPAIHGYTEEAEFVQEFELQGEVQESGDTATAKAHAVLNNGEETAEGVVTLTVANKGGSWCWDDMED